MGGVVNVVEEVQAEDEEEEDELGVRCMRCRVEDNGRRWEFFRRW